MASGMSGLFALMTGVLVFILLLAVLGYLPFAKTTQAPSVVVLPRSDPEVRYVGGPPLVLGPRFIGPPGHHRPRPHHGPPHPGPPPPSPPSPPSPPAPAPGPKPPAPSPKPAEGKMKEGFSQY